MISDVKAAIIKMLRNRKRGNLSKEIEVIKKNQMEIIELKII